MSAISEQPETLNFLSPFNFQFTVRKCPAVNFFVQTVVIPSVESITPDQPNPFTVIRHGGDHIQFEDLVITFKVDERLQNWLEIYTWLEGINFPENWDQHAELKGTPKYMGTGLTSDISILIADSNKVPKFECTFKEAFPTALSGFPLTTNRADLEFVTCQATFKYTNYTMTVLV